MTKYIITLRPQRGEHENKYYNIKSKIWVNNLGDATIFSWWNLLRFPIVWLLMLKNKDEVFKFSRILSCKAKG